MGERASQSVVLATIAVGALSVASLSAWSQESQSSTDDLTVTLAGQAMLRSDLRQTSPATVATIRALLNGDVRFTNLEGTVAEPGQTVREGRGFLTPPAALDALQDSGFNLLALADNHAFDMQATGIQNTLREADSRHLVHAGTGDTLVAAAAPGYLHTAHGTVALVASASGLLVPGARATADQPGVNELRVDAGDRPNEATIDLPGAGGNKPNAEDARRILQSIRDAKHHADLVIVYQHNHVFLDHSFATVFTEGMPERLVPAEWLQRWVHTEVDAGADVVVMHGAPLLHGIEIYHGHPIFYDLGSLVYNVPPTLTYIDEPVAWETALAYLRYSHGHLRSISLRPVVLNNIGDGQPDVHSEYTNNQFLDTRGLPTVAHGARAHYILERLAELSRPFGTVVEVQGERAQIRLPPEDR